MGILLYYLVGTAFRGLFTYRFFTANKLPAWWAFVPVWRTIQVLKLADRPTYWAFFAYVPVIDNVMSLIITYELLHMHGFRETKHTVFSVLTLGGYLGYLSHTQPLVRGTRDNDLIKRRIGTLVNNILFAVVAAGSLRAVAFEAFNIPTSSMEKSMLVGDYLFVDKWRFGLRMPFTPVSIPLTHNKIPGTELPSYWEGISVPYFRLPAFAQVDRGDAVVFNYPAEPDRPVDKKEHYVKRCVAVSGDTLTIVDRQVFINGTATELPERSNGQFSYYVRTNGTGFNPMSLKKSFDLNYIPDNYQVNNQNVSDILALSQNEFVATISSTAVEGFKSYPGVVEVRPLISPKNAMRVGYGDSVPQAEAWFLANFIDSRPLFPNPVGGHSDTLVYKWSRDNYGPLWIPKKGATIPLNPDHVNKYGRCITAYEGHTLEFINGNYLVDGKPTDSYTFSMDYYWMMGDNRHNSEDSRYWGFVPEDHIVGKPVFVFFSWDVFAKGMDRIRWNRVFSFVHGDGPQQSHLLPIGAIIALLWGINEWYTRKKRSSHS
jgi:signal peptidase I